MSDKPNNKIKIKNGKSMTCGEMADYAILMSRMYVWEFYRPYDFVVKRLEYCKSAIAKASDEKKRYEILFNRRTPFAQLFR